MSDVLLDEIDYTVTETPYGIWRRYVHPSGKVFAEYVTHAKFFRWRMVHFTWGICPETGKRITARGVVAVGRRAIGFVAVGQMATGVIAIGQLAIGGLIGIGQATTGVFALGQAALGVLLGVGQLVTGFVALGQVAIGYYAMGQVGFGPHVWDTRVADPVAKQFFRAFLP